MEIDRAVSAEGLEKSGDQERPTYGRLVVEAIRYMASTGCQWRAIPKDFPPYSTSYGSGLLVKGKIVGK
jgi:transposase